MDVSRFGLIYAGAQKNIGPAGLTIVIVREDLVGHAHRGTPSVFDYKVQADNESMYNTPPTYAIYIAGLVFQWLKRNGGLARDGEDQYRQGRACLRVLDASGFYRSPVAKDDRSRMNVPFTLRDASARRGVPEEAAKQRGLIQLKGHRSVGGMRASIYNAMPLEGVQALVEFMRDFERKHG